MSKTIAINAGSSSLKFQLYNMPEETVVAKGLIERIGLNDSVVTIKYGEEGKFHKVLDLNNHTEAVDILIKALLENKIIESFDEITGAGHRVVAGGEIFKESAIIDEEALQHIEDLGEFAPLHNPAEAAVVRAFQKVLPNVTNVAVFDTSFHTSMPKENYLYSLPYEYYEKHGARKYGAHGTSHQFVANRAAEIVGKPIEDLKIITCHLGNGASITAVKGGKSVDTSMGFTPLAGLTMGTRSGDIDASLLPFLMRKEKIETVEEMIDILNKESGLKGISGVSSDMREIEAAAKEGNERAQLSLDIFHNRVKKYIGQYAAVMNGVDVIVFTAGIGENSDVSRRQIINEVSFLGCKIDDSKNDGFRQEGIISTDDSTCIVINIPTDEEVCIARDVERLKK